MIPPGVGGHHCHVLRRLQCALGLSFIWKTAQVPGSEQMLSNFYGLCCLSPGPGEARPALGRANRADMPGNWKALNHSRAA